MKPDEQQPIHILLIEDQEEDAKLLMQMLCDEPENPFKVEWVESLSLGLTRLAGGGFNLVLLSLSLIGDEGIEPIPGVGEAPVSRLSRLQDEGGFLSRGA